MEINEKVALVLGGTKGIGKAIGFSLAQAGAKVIMTYYDWPEEAAVMRQELNMLDQEHLAIKIDLRKPSQIESLLAKVRDEFGALHILINNIERGGMPVVHGSYLPAQWDLEIDTTLKAKWWVMHHGLPLLKESGAGVVITLSSIAALMGRSGPAALIFNDGYAAANRAISLFTETWAREGAPQVRVNELMLGFFETRHAEQTRGWQLLSKKQQEAIRHHTLLKRTGRLDDIIKAIFFLIKDASFMTGSVIRLDGGYVLGGNPVPPMPHGVV